MLVRACLSAHLEPLAAQGPSTPQGPTGPSQQQQQQQQQQHRPSTSAAGSVLGILLDAMQLAGCSSPQLLAAAPVLLDLSEPQSSAPSADDARQQQRPKQPAADRASQTQQGSTAHGSATGLAHAWEAQRELLRKHTVSAPAHDSQGGAAPSQQPGSGNEAGSLAGTGGQAATPAPAQADAAISLAHLVSAPKPGSRWTVASNWRACSLGCLPSEHDPQGRLPSFNAGRLATGCVLRPGCVMRLAALHPCSWNMD